MATVTIERSGPQATVQDLGRGGYLSDGIPPSGPFDVLSLQLANLLVGNPEGDRFLVGRDPGAAGIEALLGGLRLRTNEEIAVAVTGAEAAVSVDGEPRPMWAQLLLPAGATLSVAPPSAGARVYVALAGGVDVPAVLGSRATNARARLGGLEGRTLRQDDELPLLPAGVRLPSSGAVVPEHARPVMSPPWELGVVLGPQADLFTEESVERFCTVEWRLSSLADRMGCRFEGPALEFRQRPEYLTSQAGSDPSNIVDDVTPFGGIQVPSGVEPIAMGVDFPSIGGYAKIATVVSAHIRRLGQVRPGEAVRFVPLTVEQAVQELRNAVEGLSQRLAGAVTEAT